MLLERYMSRIDMKETMMSLSKRLVFLAVCACLLGGLIAPAAAVNGAKMGLGLRPLGFSINPDQFVLGVQAVLGEYYRGRFAPSVDFGFGENLTLITGNFDLMIDLFSPPKSEAAFYIGGGPTLSYISPETGDSDTEIGLSLLGGIKLGMSEKNYYNIEARFGIGDIPDFKLLAGVMFGFGGAR